MIPEDPIKKLRGWLHKKKEEEKKIEENLSPQIKGEMEVNALPPKYLNRTRPEGYNPQLIGTIRNQTTNNNRKTLTLEEIIKGMRIKEENKSRIIKFYENLGSTYISTQQRKMITVTVDEILKIIEGKEDKKYLNPYGKHPELLKATQATGKFYLVDDTTYSKQKL